MRTVALVPINSLARAKSRLRGRLTDADRRALVRWLGGCVLAALDDCARVDDVVVVSPDVEMLAWAARSGAIPLRQEEGQLNEGLALGREWARAHEAETLLVVLGDVPLLSPADVTHLLSLLDSPHGGPAVVIAPDATSTGTNALALHPADAVPFAFGTGSFGRHVALARAAGIEPRIYPAPGTQMDIDTPDDLAKLCALGLWHPGQRDDKSA